MFKKVKTLPIAIILRLNSFDIPKKYKIEVPNGSHLSALLDGSFTARKHGAYLVRTERKLPKTAARWQKEQHRSMVLAYLTAPLDGRKNSSV
jgi:hypothetical protein